MENDGAFLAESIHRTAGVPLSPDDLLVQQGLTLTAGTTLVFTLFTTSMPDDSFCITATSTRTSISLYLSSATFEIGTKRPHGCVHA